MEAHYRFQILTHLGAFERVVDTECGTADHEYFSLENME